LPRSGGGIYSKGSPSVVTGTTIQSAAYNTTIDDLVTDANAARPISAGGTGAANAADARTNLGGTATGVAVFTAADAAAARTAIGISATNTPFTPAGNIAASNVQAALAEVDTEKAALAGATFTGGISGTTGTFSGVVSGAAASADGHLLNRLTADGRFTQRANNLSDVSSAATARTNLGISATNTPFTPAGNIAATNTQAAIAEVDTEKAALAGAAFTGTLTSAVGIGNCGSSALANTNVGNSALTANTTGANNVAIGSLALTANTTGASNVAVGRFALTNNTTANSNTAIGTNTLSANTTGADNTAVGSNALNANTTGTHNVAVGRLALEDNTTGASNVALGANTLTANTTGASNVAVGRYALLNNTTANNNTAVGSSALAANTTGANNTSMGLSALAANIIGINNVGVGVSALAANTANFNTAVGSSALAANTTGADNTAVGINALSANTTGSNCSGLGSNTAVTGSNQVQLGDSATTTYVYGTVQNRSDARDKADIRDTKLGLDFVNSLRPVDYRYDMRDSYKPERPAKPDDDATPEQVEAYEAAMQEWLEAVKLKNITHDGSKKRSRYHSGIIAQELRDAIDASGFDKKGWGALQDHSIGGGDDVLSVGYDQFVAPLIKAIQELSAKVEKLEKEAAER
jgi:uncharacterized protein YigA (DUF484 family)